MRIMRIRSVSKPLNHSPEPTATGDPLACTFYLHTLHTPSALYLFALFSFGFNRSNQFTDDPHLLLQGVGTFSQFSQPLRFRVVWAPVKRRTLRWHLLAAYLNLAKDVFEVTPAHPEQTVIALGQIRCFLHLRVFFPFTALVAPFSIPLCAISPWVARLGAGVCAHGRIRCPQWP